MPGKNDNRRRWVFRLTAAVGAPLLVLCAIELTLRMFGFGYPASFVRPCEVEGVLSRCDNPDFSRTYFPRELARPPVPFAFSEVKPEETIRIFVVGASAAQGDPDPTFGPARMLELLLEDRYPSRRFEVINAAVTAINSHVVLSIVRELTEYRPDLFIVYLGNNEVVGPYGAGTVFSPISGSWRMIRASIFARRTRSGQLLTQWTERTEKGSPGWRGMEMFVGHQVRHDDPRMEDVYAHLTRNLEEIVDAARAVETPVILTTVPSNLADCAPFASGDREGITDDELAERDEWIRSGDAQQAAGQIDAALESYLEAERLDDTHAELQFRIGQVYRSQSSPRQAVLRLTAARDLDTLRFRADTRINRQIRELARDEAIEVVALADSEDRFRDSSPEGLPGQELFFEHVHPTFSGNYRIALAWLGEIPRVLPQLQSTASRQPPDEGELARRLAYTAFDRRRVWSSVAARLTRPPFTDQLDRDDQRRHIETQIARTMPMNWPEVLATYETAMAARPEDPWLWYNLSAVLGAMGQHARAAVELQRFLHVYPHDPSARERLCQARVAQGQFEDALRECTRVTERLPEYTPPYYAMAYSLANLGRFDEAVELYRRLLGMEPEAAPQILNEIGRIEVHRGRFDQAIAVYREAVETAERTPDALIPDVRFNYGSALRAAGRHQEAIPVFDAAVSDYRRAVELEPLAIAPRLALARSLSQLGRTEEAISELEQVIALDPANPEARSALERLEALGP